MNPDDQRFVLMAAAAQAHYAKEQARREARKAALATAKLNQDPTQFIDAAERINPFLQATVKFKIASLAVRSQSGSDTDRRVAFSDLKRMLSENRYMFAAADPWFQSGRTLLASLTRGNAIGDRKLEVFSWWTSGEDALALNTLFKDYKEKDPGIEIINATVAGGGGSGARPVLQARLAGGNPPDTWRTHLGYELLDQYVTSGYCESITDIYSSEGWGEVVPKGLVDLVSKDGKAYSVVLGVHRGNVLWYNKKVLEKNGVKVGDKMTFDEFFAAADKLKKAGVTPLAVGDSGIWASAQLFENTLLGVVGPQGWKDLFSGKMSFDDPKVKEAATLYGKLLRYQNSDHSALSWDEAVKAVKEGKCAFTSMGDWTVGEFIKAGFKPNEDFGWVSHPGTDGSFFIVADGFTLAKDAPHKKEAVAWLKSIGSKRAQEVFNSLKGSIPGRTDVDRSKFGPYYQWSMASFAKDVLLPSCVHGEAAPPAFQQSLNDAVTGFVADQDVEEFVSALVQAAKESGIKK
jgi:glucose/mannose transport system substrate-binding protein